MGPEFLVGLSDCRGVLVKEYGHPGKLLVDVYEPGEEVLVGVLLLDLSRGIELLHEDVGSLLPLGADASKEVVLN